MPNLFRHPIGHSGMHGIHLACGVLKQVQHDIYFIATGKTYCYLLHK
jgi:hypothetical protein